MKHPLLITLAASTLCACSGGGPSTESQTNLAGIYSTGTITPDGGTADQAIGIIASNGQTVIVDTRSSEGFIGQLSGSQLSGKIYSDSDVAQTTGTLQSNTDGTVSGTYASNLGNGTFKLSQQSTDKALYQRGASLSTLEGTWVDTDNGTSNTTVIQKSGEFTSQNTDSCYASGKFSTIDSSKNEYAVSVTITSCNQANGTYSGLAIVEDTHHSNDTLTIVIGNNQSAGVSKLVKQ